MRKLRCSLLILSLVIPGTARAGIEYGDPTDGWNYVYLGDAAAGAPRRTPAPALDGRWRHEVGSDEWNGDGRGSGNDALGGVESRAGHLTIEDARTSGGNNDNRKLYFTHGLVDDGVADLNLLDTGITMSFRMRLTPDDGRGEIPLPNGYAIASDGKGNIGIRQSSPSSIISFSLVREVEDWQPGQDITYPAAGLLMNKNNGDVPGTNVDSNESGGSTNLLALDPTTFHEFWITIQASDGTPGNGSHTVNIYLDGSLTPTTFYVTAGTGSDVDSSVEPSWPDFIAMGCNNTTTVGAFDVDFFAYKTGLVVPAGQLASPSSPTNLIADASDAKVTLSWYTPWGAREYVIKRADSTTGPFVPIATNAEPTYVDSGLINGKTYFYVVSALNAAGESADSTQVSAKPMNSPQNLVAVAGTNEVRLTWSAMPTASSYNLKRSNVTGGPYDVLSSNLTTTTYLDSSLQSGHRYFYVASANLAAGGEGGDSAEVAALTAPAVPTNLTAIAFGTSAARVRWNIQDAVNPTVILEKSSDGTAFAPLAALTSTTRLYYETGLLPDTTNYYRVIATNSTGSSVYSDVVSVVTPVWGLSMNFANAAAPTPPGYFQDIGLAYADQTNGLSYGWDVDNTANARLRNNGNSPDLRYDTLTHLQKTTPGRIWEIALTNGLYTVHVVGGDPTASDSRFQFDVEGFVSAIYLPVTGAWWAEFNNTVLVSDGRLTITSGPDAQNNKINFVDITPAVPTPNTLAQQPQSTNTVQNSPVSFTVTVAPGGPNPYGFQWYFNNAPITDANQGTLVLQTPQTSNAGDYFVVVTNAGAAATSVVATLTVALDTAPPQLVSVGSINGSTIGVAFNEFVDPILATDLTKYSINGGAVSASSAILREDLKTVMLIPATPITGAFTVAVSDFKDLAGNTAATLSASGTVLGFTSEDLNFPALAGYSFTSDGENLEVSGGGADIWGTADSCHYMYRTLEGDFDARVRVTSLAGNNTITKGVLMMRETADPADRNVHLSANPLLGRNQVEVGMRDTFGGSTVQLSSYVPAGIPNLWLRLVRVGSAVSALRSTNGLDWITMTTTNQTYPTSVLLGMAVTAHNANEQATGVFSGFSVTAPMPDLSLAMSVNPATAIVGDTLSYTISVTNLSVVGASVATLADTLPAGLAFVSATATSGTVSHTAGVVTAALGSLGAGEGAVVQIIATATAAGTIVNSASSSSTETDANPANNVASASVSVSQPPQIEITNPGFVGGNFTFSLATQTGVSYVVQYKHQLNDPDWLTLKTIVGDGTTVLITDDAPGVDQRFYRILVQ